MEFRKMVLMNLFAGQLWRRRHAEQTCGHRREEEGGTNEESSMDRYALPHVRQRAGGNSLCDSWSSDPGLMKT